MTRRGASFKRDEERFWELEGRFEEELSSNLEEASEWIFENCGSHERMRAMMHLYGQMDFHDWLVLLGDVWSVCDNVGLYKDEIVEAFGELFDNPQTVIPELMTVEERKAFEELPEQITVYRGCGPQNRPGMSWSLSRDIAVRFPFSMRYGTDQPTLLTATINKARAAALKLERNEQEIIVIDLPENCWTEEHITEPPPVKNAVTCLGDLL